MACYMLAIGMEGLCCMIIPFLHSLPLLAPLSALYGYFDGAYVALIPVVTSDTVGSTYLTSALGAVYFLHGIPYLLSPPIGGKCLLTHRNLKIFASYLMLFCLCVWLQVGWWTTREPTQQPSSSAVPPSCSAPHSWQLLCLSDTC